MPFEKIAAAGKVVESEIIVEVLRVFEGEEREFSCLVITAGRTHARLIDGKGEMAVATMRALRIKLEYRGFSTFSYERADGRTRTFKV